MQKVSSKLPLKKNKNRKMVKIKKLTCKSFPIKDIELIEKIKTTYKKNNNHRGLLAFVLSINTGLKITDLLNLKVGDVSNKDILSIFDTYQPQNVVLWAPKSKLYNSTVISSDYSAKTFLIKPVNL